MAEEQQRYCKRCKGVFTQAVCPAGHPNFSYTKVIPDGATVAVAATRATAGAAATVAAVDPDAALMAAHRGDAAEVARLLAAGLDPDDPIYYGKKFKGGAPLQYAAIGGHAEVIRLLLAEGKAQVSRQNTHDGSSALHYACDPPGGRTEPWAECVAVLLEFGSRGRAPVGTRQRHGRRQLRPAGGGARR